MIYDYAFESERATWATGGAERQQWLLARALASAGWSVTVGVRRPELQPGQARHADGVRFVDIGREHILLAWRRFFKRERADWWLWQCASHLFGFGVVLAHWSGTKTIFAAGVDRDVRVRDALYQRPRWWPAYALGLWRTDRIVLQHGGQRAGLRRRWSGKAHVVPNIISGSDQVIPRAMRVPVVSWIAALRVAKRPDRLIEIARLLPQVRFVVCGSPSTYMTPPGYSERAIEMFRATPNIEYRGQVSPTEALEVARTSTLLLSTSVEEGFPQTFLEAWKYGTPVVTLGIDPDGVVGALPLGAVCRDVHAAASAIVAFIDNAELWQRASLNAQDYVRRAHSPAAALSALERALHGPSSPSSAGTSPTRAAV